MSRSAVTAKSIPGPPRKPPGAGGVRRVVRRARRPSGSSPPTPPTTSRADPRCRSASADPPPSPYAAAAGAPPTTLIESAQKLPLASSPHITSETHMSNPPGMSLGPRLRDRLVDRLDQDVHRIARQARTGPDAEDRTSSRAGSAAGAGESSLRWPGRRRWPEPSSRNASPRSTPTRGLLTGPGCAGGASVTSIVIAPSSISTATSNGSITCSRPLCSWTMVLV